jgi:MFS family permease
MFPLVIIPSALGFGVTAVVILFLVRLTGFSALFIDPINREHGKISSWKVILTEKKFYYYILPWLLVNIADGLRLLIWGNFQQFSDYNDILMLGYYVRYLGVGFFGFIAGVVADRVGRKKPIYVALFLMAISFAFLGYISTISMLLFLIISGVGWSFLFVVYFSVFGDIASKHSKERYYALGWIAPIAILMGFSSLTGVFQIDAPVEVVSIFLSIVIFLSIIPVFFAQETLPESSLRARNLKEYLKKVGDIKKEVES